MNREANEETPSLLRTNKNNNNKIEQESKPPFGGGGGSSGGGGGDRVKRDEWSEGAVSSLLEAYESKWVLRNRAKLKGQDWEDVAKHVSHRANSTKTPKTQTQCKNKIESMKKRYRLESVGPEASTWPLYPRLDLLLRGNAASPRSITPQLPPPPPATVVTPPNLTSFEPPQPPQVRKQPPPPITAMPVRDGAQNSHSSNGVDGQAKKEGDEVVGKPSDQESDKNGMDTDSSTPALYSDREKSKPKNFTTRKKKKQRGEELEIAESIRWLAEVIMRSEQARLETMKEVEKMRAEAEAKRGEMDLKRTEIIANTQLEIAKLFAGIGRGVDSSLRIG